MSAMKRIVVCMDGTWQRLDKDASTNIATIARSIAHTDAAGVHQIVVYSRGVGAYSELSKRNGGGLLGGAFGRGLEESLLDAYLRLAFNYNPGDEIYVFGFSRGAFQARSLAGLIGKVGIVSRRYAEMAPEAFRLYRDRRLGVASDAVLAFRRKYGKRIRFPGNAQLDSFYDTRIAYVGVFDTVGQRGLPSVFGPISDIANARYAFHDLALGEHVDSARHALAIDERRWMFPPTLWSNVSALNAKVAPGAPAWEAPYQQRWFPGAHGDVGGGARGKLFPFPLQWIIEGAERRGLAFDRVSDESCLNRVIKSAEPDPAGAVERPRGLGAWAPTNWPLAARRIRRPERGMRAFPPEIALEHVHEVAAVRYARFEARGKRYAPAPLKRFTPALKAMAAGVEAIAAAAAFVGRR